MDEARLVELLASFQHNSVLVVGDFFLDKYLILEHSLSEVSLETGLEAYQVVEVRCQPGAAGTIASNLRALDVAVTALGVIGDDGEGYELKRGLTDRGVCIEPLVQRCGRGQGAFTPTYMKPVLREADGSEHEISRLDMKNRSPLPRVIEEHIVEELRVWTPRVQGVIIADQVQERDHGVITDRVRNEIARLARTYPNVVFAADSRAHIGLFREVIIKPNEREAALAVLVGCARPMDLPTARRSGRELFRRNQKPVYVTVGADGILLFTEEGEAHVPAPRVTGDIDIVGAGDSSMAGIVASLCSGASYRDAAIVGNLVASITIQQIGTTGTASRAQVREQFRQWIASWKSESIEPG